MSDAAIAAGIKVAIAGRTVEIVRMDGPGGWTFIETPGRNVLVVTAECYAMMLRAEHDGFRFIDRPAPLVPPTYDPDPDGRAL